MMLNAKDFLFVALAVFLMMFSVVLVRGIRAAMRRRERAVWHGQSGLQGPLLPSFLHLAIGFVTNFFDTLGIGSFATTTAAYKLRGLVPVRLIPGTLNVGHTLPTIAQAFIYTRIVPVDSATLV